VIGGGNPSFFMNDDKTKYEISIHNPWVDTTFSTYDIRVAAAHMIYKSYQPPASSKENITLSIDGVGYGVQAKAFPHPVFTTKSIDTILDDLVTEITYCLDLHTALYEK